MRDIESWGSPRDIGRHHGACCAGAIRDAYRRCAIGTSMSTPDACAAKDRMLAVLKTDAPDLYVRMEGIAEGADIPFDVVANLNLRSSALGVAPSYGVAFALLAVDGPSIVGMTVESKSKKALSCFVHTVHDADTDGSSIEITPVGCVSAIAGVNKNGLAMGMVSSGTEISTAENGFPHSMVLSIAIRSSVAVEDVINSLSSISLAGFNAKVVVGGDCGGTALIDMSSSEVVVNKPLHKPVFTVGGADDAVSKIKEKRIEYLLENKDGDDDPVSLARKICCDAEGENPIVTRQSQLAFVADPVRGRLSLCRKPLSPNDFVLMTM